MDTQVYFISLHFDIILLTVLYSVMNDRFFLPLIRGITVTVHWNGLHETNCKPYSSVVPVSLVPRLQEKWV